MTVCHSWIFCVMYDLHGQERQGPHGLTSSLPQVPQKAARHRPVLCVVLPFCWGLLRGYSKASSYL